MCNIEFPHFGASYPDAHCINGYLWDMDSYENGCYTIGGDDPCPFCNTETWLKTVLDNEEFASREEALEWVEKMREKWGAEHSGSSEIPNDLKEAAARFSKNVSDGHNYRDLRVGFIAGAEWQKEQYHFFNEAWADDMQYQLNRNYENGKQAMKEQMMKEAMDGKVVNDGGEYQLIIPALRTALSKMDEGDKVRIIIVKEDGK